MDHSGKTKKPLQKKKSTAQHKDNNAADPLELNKGQTENENSEAELDFENLKVIEEISELFSNEDIVSAVKKFNADSEEKEIAAEFASSHIQFLNQIVESDYKKGIARNDAEIRDVVSYVNTMLLLKNEYLFTTIVTHSPLHYKNIQKKYNTRVKKEEKK